MAEQIFDTESFLRKSLEVLQANLNSEITKINTDKGDFTLEAVNAAAWYLNLIPKQFSYPVFILYGIASEELSDFQEGAILKAVTIQFEIGVVDKNWKDSEAAVYRLLRYRRALEAVVSKNYRSFGNGKKPIVQGLTPASLTKGDNRFEFSGINITIQLDA